ncbi:MAG: glycosyl hydrolase family 28-related protein [Bryobacteraceae bacterium]
MASTCLAAAIWLFPAAAAHQELLAPAPPGAKSTLPRNATYPTADYLYPADIGYYNVRKYGAKGDGVTDDTAAIKSAMAASLSGANQPNRGAGGRGGTVYFPSGIYVVSSTLLWAQLGNSPARISASVDPKRGCITGFKILDGGSGYFNSWGGPGLYFTGGGGSGVEAYTDLDGSSIRAVHGVTGANNCLGHGFTSPPTVTPVNWRAYLRFEGQNKATTIIKLKDHLPAFSNPNCNISNTENVPRQNCQAVIFTASEGEVTSTAAGGNAYMNDIWNLTVNIGSGNPGAIAIDWIGSNRASVKNVNIISGDGKGRCGLNVSRNLNGAGGGPGYVKNVSISGFDYGINANSNTAQVGYTFEHINLENQNIYGVLNVNMPNWFRAVSSTNSVPVFANQSSGSLTIVDGNFSHGASSTSAILNQASNGGGLLFVRNITTSGYQSALATGRKNTVIGAANIAEYASIALSQFPSTMRSLDLPVEETPEWIDNNFADWASVSSYSPDSQPNSGRDATAGIQTALNSGKPVIYFPFGQYTTSSTLYIPGTVRKILGSDSMILGPNRQRQNFPVFSCQSTSGHPVEIRNFNFDISTVGYPTISNSCPSDLVLADIHNANGYSNTRRGTGRLFIENVDIPGPPIFNNQTVWARQLDVESGGMTHCTANGGRLWIFGYKTEGVATLWSVSNATFELLGEFGSNDSPPKTMPAFVFRNSSFSLSDVALYNGWATLLSETRNGATRTSPANREWNACIGIGLYSGHN